MDKNKKLTFVNYSALKYATKTRLNPKRGDIAYCEKEDKNYGFNGKVWVPLEKMEDATLPTGLTAYDANKQIVSQLPPMTEEEREAAIETINDFRKRTDNTYYMFLCKECSHYTVFAYNGIGEYDFKTLGEGIFELANSCNFVIKTIHDNGTDIEIWAEIKENQIECCHLFGYDLGVVTYGT